MCGLRWGVVVLVLGVAGCTPESCRSSVTGNQNVVTQACGGSDHSPGSVVSPTPVIVPPVVIVPPPEGTQ